MYRFPPRLRSVPAALALAAASIAAPLVAQEQAAPPEQAQASPPEQAQAPLAAVDKLKPGEFLWAPQIAPEGPVTIIVSLKAQRAFVYRNGVPIGVTTVSTGRKGYETPTGVFTILQKEVDHKSNLYDDAPMPFMQRLTWSGVALHGGQLPGYPASHGCIRLPHAFAKLLYGVTRLGLTVVITDQPEVPQVVAGPGIMNGTPADGQPEPTAFSWHPELAPTGPLSIVVSARDGRMIVLRNGVQIGSSEIAIDGPVPATEAFTLRSIDAEGTHWMRLPLPGNAAKDAAGELTPEERARGHLPQGFRDALAGVLVPGTTVLVTRDTLQSAGTGTRVTLITSDKF